MKKKGILITFEGPEGSGKSTQVTRMASFICRSGRRVLVLREPGGTRISEAVRDLLLSRKFEEMSPKTELLLYLAARAQLVEQKILPCLQKGHVVICDRFEDSSLAYQGFGRGLALEDIQSVSRSFVRGTLMPDLTVLLDIDPAQGLRRGGRHDRMEKQSLEFHKRVRQGFLDLARQHRRRYLVINGKLPKGDIAERIRQRVRRLLD